MVAVQLLSKPTYYDEPGYCYPQMLLIVQYGLFVIIIRIRLGPAIKSQVLRINFQFVHKSLVMKNIVP
jgi:hypothetical protein